MPPLSLPCSSFPILGALGAACRTHRTAGTLTKYLPHRDRDSQLQLPADDSRSQRRATLGHGLRCATGIQHCPPYHSASAASLRALLTATNHFTPHHRSADGSDPRHTRRPIVAASNTGPRRTPNSHGRPGNAQAPGSNRCETIRVTAAHEPCNAGRRPIRFAKDRRRRRPRLWRTAFLLRMSVAFARASLPVTTTRGIV